MEDKIVEILGQLQTSVTDLAPEAWMALVVAAKVDAILSLAYCATIITLSAVWGVTVRPLLKKIEAMSDPEPALVVWGGASLVLAVLLVIAVCVLFSTSTWLGVFYPEAAVVRDLLSKAAD